MSRVYSLILSIGVLVIALDQWTKHLALQALVDEGHTRAFMSWFSFTLVHNHGAAFGMFRDMNESIRGAFFLLLPLSVLALLWWTYVRKFRSEETLGPVAMGLVLGGAIGNLIDRLRLGYVIDFIDWFYPSSSGKCLPQFHLDGGQCHWPVFNVADSAITFAMVLLIVYAFLHSQEAKKESASAA